ncbi:MAG TPA: hypothetical protein VKD47_04975 [Miltoncostaeaceae bacterium]|nr:hypothetical protein [Miltoncostaeaceae bacterium]
MPSESFWAGWVSFAGILMLVMGTIEFCEGLIAILRGGYYGQTQQQIVVFDLRTWGWITLIWGIVVALAGAALLARQTWARWVTIVVGSLNFIVQLGFVGSRAYPLWALVALAINVLVLYALMMRWEDVKATPL